MGTESENYTKLDVLEAIRKLANERTLRSRTEFLVKLPKHYNLNISTLRRYMLELGIKKNMEGFYKLPDEVELKLQREELSSLFTRANLDVIKDINFTFLSTNPNYVELLIHELRNHPILKDRIISMIPSTDGILVITNNLVEFNREIKEIKKIKNIND
ncbi:hypothetical protein SAMN05446037_105014 [Anaerovirgula multivorans]|uniref:Arginine repressor n=1 Tax=Anaerovirgula multivorans TaxID=312168 RepID=A0A239KMK0_9FIRM|nr:hypothetical protein [Anaerovirgula multivorans]SNT19295.1 hypothetical protein SAMN05446037_105014 [Anaerovirgula multivorans]